MKLFITLLFILFFQSAKAQNLAADYKHIKTSPLLDQNHNAGNIETKSVPDFFLIFYKKVISPQDNTSCPLHPSCSSFSSQAFKRNSLVTGYLLTFDRLLRCNGLPGMFEYYQLDETQRFFLDPIDNYSSSE